MATHPDPSGPGRQGADRARRGVALAGIIVALVVAGCSPGTATAPAATSAAPTGPSGTAAGDAAFSPLPSGTPWPGNVPDAIIALGKLDEQVAVAGQSLDAAIQAEDVKALVAAARGLVDLVDGNAENVRTVQGYAGTKQLGDAYANALATVRAGAQSIVDGSTKGDSKAVDAGVAALGQGITLYGLARRALGPMLEQAISMKRMLVK